MPDKNKSINKNLNLDLPFDPKFISTPPQYTLAEMIKICEKMLPFWNQKRKETLVPAEKIEPFEWKD